MITRISSTYLKLSGAVVFDPLRKLRKCYDTYEQLHSEQYKTNKQKTQTGSNQELSELGNHILHEQNKRELGKTHLQFTILCLQLSKSFNITGMKILGHFSLIRKE